MPHNFLRLATAVPSRIPDRKDRNKRIVRWPALCAFDILVTCMFIECWIGAPQVRSRFQTAQIALQLHFWKVLLTEMWCVWKESYINYYEVQIQNWQLALELPWVYLIGINFVFDKLGVRKYQASHVRNGLLAFCSQQQRVRYGSYSVQSYIGFELVAWLTLAQKPHQRTI